MAIAKPFLQFTDEAVARRLNMDLCVGWEPSVQVEGALDQRVDVYAISFTMLHTNGSTFKEVIKFSGEAARDAAVAALDLALSTVVNETP